MEEAASIDALEEQRAQEGRARALSQDHLPLVFVSSGCMKS